VLGVGDASGMFPIDSKTNDYDASKIELFNERLEAENIAWKLRTFFPKFLRQEMPQGCLPNKEPSCSTPPHN
jgi:hypothetical protein